MTVVFVVVLCVCIVCVVCAVARSEVQRARNSRDESEALWKLACKERDEAKSGIEEREAELGDLYEKYAELEQQWSKENAAKMRAEGELERANARLDEAEQGVAARESATIRRLYQEIDVDRREKAEIKAELEKARAQLARATRPAKKPSAIKKNSAKSAKSRKVRQG